MRWVGGEVCRQPRAIVVVNSLCFGSSLPPGVASRQAAPAPRRAPYQDDVLATRATAAIPTTTAAATTSAAALATLVPRAKRALTTAALAVVLASAAVSVGEVAGGAGAGGGGIVAPAFAELEPLPLKSYSDEFSSGLAPVNTVRGKPLHGRQRFENGRQLSAMLVGRCLWCSRRRCQMAGSGGEMRRPFFTQFCCGTALW